jgi:hypothetical protein
MLIYLANNLQWKWKHKVYIFEEFKQQKLSSMGGMGEI